MKYRILHRPSVTSDIEQAFEYYKLISSNLSDAFLARLGESVDFISKKPAACQVRYKKVRTCLLKQFPYHIHYLIFEEQRIVYVVAVLHAFRKTEK